MARSQIEYAQLQAVQQGTIADVQISEGENVSPGRPAISLTFGEGIEVLVAVPEAIISRIKRGDAATVNFEALEGVEEEEGVVTAVGVTPTQMETTYPVTITLSEPDPKIRPGMTAQVRLKLETDTERMVVPPVAISQDREGTFGFVVEVSEQEGVGVTRRRPVVPGELTSDGLEIVEGLSNGDVLVTAGVSRIRDGMEVKLPEALTP